MRNQKSKSILMIRIYFKCLAFLSTDISKLGHLKTREMLFKMPVNNHDSTFKQLMSHRNFLEGFIKTYLPQELLSQFNWDSIKFHKMGGAFIEENTSKAFQSDVIYLAEMNSEENMLWVHFEHQSSPDESMTLRVLSYQIAELLNYRKQYPTKKLPTIVTLIYHQGEKKWPYSLDIQDLFLNPRLAMKYFGKPILVDLPTLSDEDLKKHLNIGPVEVILKQVRQKGFEKKLRLMISELRGVDYHSKEIVLKYLLYFIDMPNSEYLKTIGECLPEDKELAMSLAERLVQQGIEQGMQRGLEQGLEQGLERGLEQGIWKGLQQGAINGKFEVAQSMFLEGFDENIIRKITNLPEEVLASLKKN